MTNEDLKVLNEKVGVLLGWQKGPIDACPVLEYQWAAPGEPVEKGINQLPRFVKHIDLITTELDKLKIPWSIKRDANGWISAEVDGSWAYDLKEVAALLCLAFLAYKS